MGKGHPKNERIIPTVGGVWNNSTRYLSFKVKVKSVIVSIALSARISSSICLRLELRRLLQDWSGRRRRPNASGVSVNKHTQAPAAPPPLPPTLLQLWPATLMSVLVHCQPRCCFILDRVIDIDYASPPTQGPTTDAVVFVVAQKRNSQPPRAAGRPDRSPTGGVVCLGG